MTKAQVTQRIKHANRVTLTRHYLRQGLLGWQGGNLPEDFSPPQEAAGPVAEAIYTFGAVVAFVLVMLATAWLAAKLGLL